MNAHSTASRLGPNLGIAIAASAAGVLMGAAAFWYPLFALTGALIPIAAVGALVLYRFRAIVPALFLGALGVVLAGYALFGRAFAYLGVPPVFIGELMLAFGIAAVLASGALRYTLRSSVTWAIFAFAALGFLRTVPFLGPYGVDALRDATLWAYAAFAIAIAGCALRSQALPSVAHTYGRWLRPFAAWLPIVLAVTRFLGDFVPDMPGTNVSLLSMKPGDAGVHLAGAAVFVLLGLYRPPGPTEVLRPKAPRFFWALWFTSMLFVAALTRGGFLSVLVALAVTAVFEPVAVGRRLTLAVVALLLLGILIVPLSLQLDDTSRTAQRSEERALSARQVIENVLSIAGYQSEARGNLSSTREWRLDWWTSIVDYTIFGPYFWTGRGFGVNLANEDGFQVSPEDEAPLRSPHNVYMTVLARMGVPGTALWLAFQALFFLSMVRAFLHARLTGAVWWARLQLWILAYWCAFLVNATFDVFLEGPQGGIWFWCLTGLGIASATASSRSIRTGQFRRVAA